MESGIQGFGIQNRDQVPQKGMKSTIQVPLEKTGIQHPAGIQNKWNGIGQWDPESKTVLYSLTWGDSTGLWTASYYFFFIYLPLIRSPHLKSFVNKISIRRFLPFTDCFFVLRVVSFLMAFVFTLQETVRSPRLLLYRSQLIKKLAHANNKVSTLISNRATSVKVTRK